MSEAITLHDADSLGLYVGNVESLTDKLQQIQQAQQQSLGELQRLLQRSRQLRERLQHPGEET